MNKLEEIRRNFSSVIRNGAEQNLLVLRIKYIIKFIFYFASFYILKCIFYEPQIDEI